MDTHKYSATTRKTKGVYLALQDQSPICQVSPYAHTLINLGQVQDQVMLLVLLVLLTATLKQPPLHGEQRDMLKWMWVLLDYIIKNITVCIWIAATEIHQHKQCLDSSFINLCDCELPAINSSLGFDSRDWICLQGYEHVSFTEKLPLLYWNADHICKISNIHTWTLPSTTMVFPADHWGSSTPGVGFKSHTWGCHSGIKGKQGSLMNWIYLIYKSLNMKR